MALSQLRQSKCATFLASRNIGSHHDGVSQIALSVPRVPPSFLPLNFGPHSVQLPGLAEPRDTLAALDRLRAACSRLRKNLPTQAHLPLSRLELTIRSNPNPAEAYNMVPGRDPQNG